MGSTRAARTAGLSTASNSTAHNTPKAAIQERGLRESFRELLIAFRGPCEGI